MNTKCLSVFRSSDPVHQAVQSMWSPPREDFKRRLHEEFGNVDFSIDDIELHYQLSPDVSAIKGRAKLPETHRRGDLPLLLSSQALLSCDVMHVAGAHYLIGVINSPRENAIIGNALLEEVANESSKEATAAATSLGKRVQQLLGFDVKVECDKARSIEFSKHQIEGELQCHVEQVSGHVDYAEAAIKATKRRVRVKSSSLACDANAAALTHAVIGAALIINRAIRKGSGNRSAHKALSPHREASFKRLYSFPPTDLVEATTRSSNSTQRLRATTATPLHPSVNDNNDWDFYSLETGGFFASDRKLAREAPWACEARLRMKRLALSAR